MNLKETATQRRLPMRLHWTLITLDVVDYELMAFGPNNGKKPNTPLPIATNHVCSAEIIEKGPRNVYHSGLRTANQGKLSNRNKMKLGRF